MGRPRMSPGRNSDDRTPETGADGRDDLPVMKNMDLESHAKPDMKCLKRAVIASYETNRDSKSIQGKTVQAKPFR